jgi:hypothetical protein
MERRAFVIRGLAAVAAGFVTSPLQALAALAEAKPPVTPPSAESVAKFTKSLKGTIYQTGAPEYEKLRKGFAAKVDLHPALIVHATSADDVSKAVLFAKTQKLPLAIRCGGHSYAGYNTCEGGLIIDLSGLDEVVLAPDKNSVRAGGGVLAHGVEETVAKVGRAAVMGQCPSVGIGGYLTGGGVGPLMNKYGLACDNVTEAEVVLADGRIVTANANQNTDLFWAIRGGGGNFGVVTSFTISLHPVSQVYAGMIGIGADNISDLLHMVRDVAALATDDLTTIGGISGNGKGGFEMWLQVCYLGEASGSDRALAVLQQSKGIIADQIKAIDIHELEAQVPMDIPPMLENYMAGFVPTLSDEVIKVFADTAATAPGRLTLTIMPVQGAVTRVPISATAFPLRSEGFAFGLSCGWKPTETSAKSEQWIKTTTANLRPFSHGAYVNVMDRDSGHDAVADAYGDNYRRLAKIKAKYDPNNLFAINQNILPRA